MQVEAFSISGLKDNSGSVWRQQGYFSEVFKRDWFRENVSDVEFVQDNESLSAQAGTVRGLHFQAQPFAQGKLVRCLRGRLFDVAVDIRTGSPTFGQWTAVELSPEKGEQLWIPAGFAHGFMTLVDDTVISYKVTAPYSAAHDHGVKWDDPAIGIDWPKMDGCVLSDKDAKQPSLAELPEYFTYEKLKLMMRVLVTGGAGFIGSALVRYLVSEVGADVLTIDKLTYAGNLASLKPIENAPNHRFLQADICDRAAMNDAFATFQPDYVMHLAAESHVDRSITGAADFIQTNINGTFTMLEAARQYWSGLADEAKANFRMLHVSTDEVYGSLGEHGLFEETTPYDPSSPYSASKAASDHLATAWQRTYGLPVVISNCSNNYGPFHFPEKLIPLIILNALEGKPLPVYGNGANIRDWLYVDDHARALWLIVQKGLAGEKYNVGGRNEQKNIDVVNCICSILDELRPQSKPHAELIKYVTDRPGHDARYAIDATKLETELGWKAQENFATGIRKTVEWYLENGWWWEPLRQGVYSGERLGVLAKD